MPRFFVIYVKRTAKTPKKKKITIVEKRLFPYIPFYVARYENELVSERGYFLIHVNALII